MLEAVKLLLRRELERSQGLAAVEVYAALRALEGHRTEPTTKSTSNTNGSGNAKSAYVYAIQRGVKGPVKIGYTRQGPEVRMAALQTATPEKLVLLGWLPTCSHTGTEAAFHEALAAHRLEGEWFAPHSDVMALVRGWMAADSTVEELKRAIQLLDGSCRVKASRERKK